MRLYFKTIINRKKPGHWTAFIIEKSKPYLFFSFTRNDQFKQWFCNATILPFYFSKNNCVLTFGIYLLWIKIGFHVQGSFYGGVRRKKDISRIDLKFQIPSRR